MNIYLVRHAQSNANVDNTVLYKETNVGIKLTAKGITQAHETGHFLAEELEKAHSVKVWNSPYERTRMTASFIKQHLQGKNIAFSEEESIYLSERQFGLIDNSAQYVNDFPAEAEHYMLHKKQGHDFFVRPPLGESPFDMCMRLDFFIKSILLNHDNYYSDHVIVSHGAALRGIIMMMMKWNYEQYAKMPNPNNASVHLIHGSHEMTYSGAIFQPSLLSV
jgi:broad specificity phosphatase PhoE